MDYTFRDYYGEFINIETKALLASKQADDYKVNIHIVKELNDIIVQLDRLSTKFLSGEFGNDKIINTFNKKMVKIKNNLDNIVLSLQSDYTNAENIYIELNNSLIQLKDATNKLKELNASRPSKPKTNENYTEEENIELHDKWMTEVKKWEKQIIELKRFCEELTIQINSYISYLESIDGVEAKEGASGIKVPNSVNFEVRYQNILNQVDNVVINTIKLGSNTLEVNYLKNDDDYEDGYYIEDSNGLKFKLVDYNVETGQYTRIKLNPKLGELPSYAKSIEYKDDGSIIYKDGVNYYDNDEKRISLKYSSKTVDSNQNIVWTDLSEYLNEQNNGLRYKCDVKTYNHDTDITSYEKYFSYELDGKTPFCYAKKYTYDNKTKNEIYEEYVKYNYGINKPLEYAKKCVFDANTYTATYEKYIKYNEDRTPSEYAEIYEHHLTNPNEDKYVNRYSYNK